jgi:glyoxylase-like metal-dependent hydrolase (beta-lactamase superfamily II)
MQIYRLVFSPIEVNTYIIADDDNKCAVIDCGCYTEQEFKEFTDFLEKKNLEPVLLLNTHCHLDHIFGNGRFLEKYKLGSLSHSGDEMNRKNSVKQALFFGLKMEAPPEPAGLIEDGQIITFGPAKLKALHVPGHSPGSLAFYIEKDGIVFTGDSLFAGSIGRTDLPGGNYDTLINSIKTKLFTLPAETVVYPGHHGSTTIGQEIDTNPYFT